MINIRNFCIIAHIDHGKSTLADRLLEFTHTVEARSMKAQYLDSMDLERERGITIKMAPVKMFYDFQNVKYNLNLIDTPGHSDFAYEVSRALTAVEGAILLVDATQGIQAQTLANYFSAKQAGLKIIGVVNKIDAPQARPEEVAIEIANLLSIEPENVLRISGKTGVGVSQLIETVIKNIPSPKISNDTTRNNQALIFDSMYDDHKGIIAYVRVFGGEFKSGDITKLCGVNEIIKIKEVGFFLPKLMAGENLKNGEIGYIATGIKDPNKLKIGDTIGEKALPGYKEPLPVVFVSMYPHEDSEYENIKVALNRLKLNDASFTFEPERSEVLGRGFKCGFLGRLHFEIISERIRREFGEETVNSFPSVAYRVKINGVWTEIKNPKDFPSDYDKVMQPMVRLQIVTPPNYLGDLMRLQSMFRLSNIETNTLGEYILVGADLPMSDLISDFDDKLKSVSQGYASFSYERIEDSSAQLVRLEILVANDVVPGLTRVVFRDEAEKIGRSTLDKLKELLPKQQFPQALQASAYGRILARENIPALKKDVTGYLYGGDRTRKMKLWKKQARGKKRLTGMGTVIIEPKVFKELLKK